MKDRNMLMQRLATFAMVSLAAFVGLADSEYVHGEGYWAPNEDGFQYNSNGKYLTPSGEQLLYTGDQVIFTAKPDKGWSVDHWRKSFQDFDPAIGGDPGELISGTEGKLKHTQGWVSTSKLFIAVKFKYLAYNLTYDGNGASSPQGESGVLYTNKITLAKAPTAPTGKSFKVWKDEESNVEFTAGKTGVTGKTFKELDEIHLDDHDVTLKAIWTNNIYTVTFNANGGSVTPTSMTVEYGKKYGDDLPTPTWNEHTFLGWFLGETEVTSSSIVTITANSELKAKWSLNTYTVSFDVTGDGQGTVSPTSATVASGETVTVTATPAENSRFVRWTDGETGLERQIVVKSNATYVANFEKKKYTVTFYWNAADGSDTNESQIVRWGDDATAPEVPARTGHSFKGWDKSYTNVKDNLDVHAQYATVQYLVQFFTDGGDGTGTVDQVSKERGYGEKFEVTATPAEGSEFIGWKDGDDTNPRTITVTEPSTYTAVFDLKRFDVTFNWKTGANVATQETQRIAWGTAVTPPADAVVDSRIGYSWTGWDVSSDEFVSVKSNLTVNANYEPHHYTVRYDVTGSKGDAPDPQTFAYDEQKELRQCLLKSDENLNFWAWKHDETGEIYIQTPDGVAATVSNLTAEADSVVTLKALWDVGDLSRAMKCDNLYWKESSDPGWKPGQDFAVWENAEEDAYMFATVQTNGVLSFDWKVEGPLDDQMEMYLFYHSNSDHALWRGTVANNEWHHEEVSVPLRQESDHNYGFPLEVRLGLYVPGNQVTAFVRNVTWTPTGGNPDPEPENAVKISSAEIVNGSFKLSFPSDAKFDYNLLTNANLLIDSWGVMTNKVGDGKLITFEPEIQSGVPQMFYKVETIRKK